MVKRLCSALIRVIRVRTAWQVRIVALAFLVFCVGSSTQALASALAVGSNTIQPVQQQSTHDIDIILSKRQRLCVDPTQLALQTHPQSAHNSSSIGCSPATK